MDDMAEQDSQELEGDPRIVLAQWVNNSDEWIRSIVRQVLGSNDQISEAELAQIYQLLKEEKGIDGRVLSTQPPIAEPTQALGQSEPLFLTRISNIKGVNALTEGEAYRFRQRADSSVRRKWNRKDRIRPYFEKGGGQQEC